MQDLIGVPIVQAGVKELHNDCAEGPQYGVGVVSVMPAQLIKMNTEIVAVMRDFRRREDSNVHQYSYREEDVNWRRVKSSGDETLRIVRLMMSTPGVQLLYLLPWGLMALGWRGKEEYFPGMLDRMKEVLTVVYGEIEFVDVPNNQMFFPNKEGCKVGKELGVNIPL